MSHLITSIITSKPGSGKSVLDTWLRLRGVQVISGPMHTDGPEEFAEADRQAHTLDACLPLLHDTVLDATDVSMSDDTLRKLLAELPQSISKQAKKWGWADTDVREQLHSYLSQNGL